MIGIFLFRQIYINRPCTLEGEYGLKTFREAKDYFAAGEYPSMPGLKTFIFDNPLR